MRRKNWFRTLGLAAPITAFAVLIGCSSGSGRSTPTGPTLPKIQDVNSSTTPASQPNLPIEIDGSGFQDAPGKVTFTQGNLSVDVVPAASAWSGTGVVATIPAGDGTTNFTAPGVLNITVTTSGGTSNAVAVALAGPRSFAPGALTWSATTPLPAGLSGLRAVAVPGNSGGNDFAVVTGGYGGTGNTSTVFSIVLNQDGTVGNAQLDPLWTSITTNPLPTPIAHHAMAEADDTNSLVPLRSRYIYVIGGQVLSNDAAGSANVYMASVDSSTGNVGQWTLTSSLPQALFGHAATVYDGYLYVAGGIGANGTPISAVYSAPIHSNGTLGPWTTAKNSLPGARAFGTMFAFGGMLYYINGDVNIGIAPNDQDLGNTNVFYASAVRGAVGSWTRNGNPTIENRAKGILFTAFGQVISGEGVYSGGLGFGEMETSTVNTSNTTNNALNPWGNLASSQTPAANVYNAAALTGPLLPTTNAPRFLLLGGQKLTGTSGPGGTLSSTVYFNTTP